jgi:hypothetical protein
LRIGRVDLPQPLHRVNELHAVHQYTRTLVVDSGRGGRTAIR